MTDDLLEALEPEDSAYDKEQAALSEAEKQRKAAQAKAEVEARERQHEAHVAASWERWYSRQEQIECRRCGARMPSFGQDYCSRACELGYKVTRENEIERWL